MPDPTWTKTPPTEPGWYWWREIDAPDTMRPAFYTHDEDPTPWHPWGLMWQPNGTGEYWPSRIPEPTKGMTP